MRLVADFHLHSKFSRATSPQMNLEIISQWAKWKGIDLIGSSDFTHPFWFGELKKKLEPVADGLYKLRGKNDSPYFILTTEISSIYTQGGRVRKIHNIIFAPSLETVAKINERLTGIGNLYSDGRPILGFSAHDLAGLIFQIDPRSLVVPAHAWTPWFSIFGSNSGFDSIEECFGELTPKIFAIETGLSSDPAMNWRLSALDKISLISCSDAHSPANLMREACVFEVAKDAELNYDLIVRMLQRQSVESKLAYTIEFFPEEGKYHFDGHRNCGVRLLPAETKTHQGRCPKCGRPLTVGVLNRVEVLADRPEGFQPEAAVPYKSLVGLDKIIAGAIGQATGTKAVLDEYHQMISQFGSEFEILVDHSLEDLAKSTRPKVVEGIRLVREKKIQVVPGYDGEFGIVSVFGGEEKNKLTGTLPASPAQSPQPTLF